MKLLNLLNQVLPKKDKRLVLYANLGFRDNVKALYDDLIRRGYAQDYELVCVSKEFYATPRVPGVRYVNPYLGLYYFLTSRYFFYCFGKYPIKPSKNQEVINLWHGMPLKKIGNLQPGLEHKDYNYFTKLVASSPMFLPIMQDAFRAREEQMLLLGNVRNDELFHKDIGDEIVWMPTYRASKGNQEGSDSTLIFNLNQEDWLELDQCLLSRGRKLALKLHPLEEQAVSVPASCQAIRLLTDQTLSQAGLSLYQYLGTTVGLITDYSSVFLDYLLLDRPLAFTRDDLALYGQDRGFVFDDLTDFLVGPQLATLADLKSYVDQTLSGASDPYREQRQQLNERVNSRKRDFCQALLDELGLPRQVGG